MTPLEYATSQIGIVEEWGNRGIPFDRYAFKDEEPGPWCARGIRWCFINAGTPLPGQRHQIGRVQTMRDELAKRGAIISPVAVLLPGDLLFLRDRGDSDTGQGEHVAIIETACALTVNSIDFNWGDSVQRVARERHSSKIRCFARWPLATPA